MASRKPGNITQRGKDAWLVRISLPADENGTRRFYSKTVRGTLKEAQKHLADELEKQNAGVLLAPSSDRKETKRQTLRAYLKNWVDTKKANARTLHDYRSLIKRYVEDHEIGMIRIPDLRPDHLRRFYLELQARELGPRTVQYVHAVISSGLKRAVKDRLIPRNPAEDARDVLEKLERSEKQVFTLKQAKAFLTAARADRYAALWLLLLETGLRPGEALGLKWGDLEGGALRVQRALKEPMGKGQTWRLERPKTKKSVRAVPLTPNALAALKEWKAKQAEERLKLGEYWANECEPDMIFTSSVGTYLRQGNLHRRHFKPLLTAAKVPDMRMYDLRHSAATLLLALGENPKVVQERLGHSTIAQTMDTYSHVLEGMQQQATNKLAKAFG